MRSLIDLLNEPYTALAQSSPIDHSQSSTPHLTLDSAPSFTSSSYTQLEPPPCGQLPWNVPTPSFRDHIPDTTDSDSLGFNSISSPSSSEALALSQRTTGTTTSDNLVEDLSALVEQIIREKPTLHQSDHKALRRFTEKSNREMMLTIFGEMLQLGRSMHTLTAPDTVYTIPNQLKKTIDRVCAQSILDWNATDYVTKIPKVVGEKLLREPSCPQDIQKNTAAWLAIQSRINKQLTHFRHYIKTELLASIWDVSSHKKRKRTVDDNTGDDDVSPTNGSMRRLARPLNILETTQRICHVMKSHLPPDWRILVMLSMRIAFLRNILFTSTINEHTNYWTHVDASLEKVQEKYGDSASMTRFLTEIFNADKAEFGIPPSDAPAR